MYDTVIIGSDLSSMIAALTSARGGFRTVLVIEGEAEIAYRENGYTFPFDAKPLIGHLNRKAFSHLFNEEAVTDALAQNEPKDPLFQIIVPGHRIDLFQDQQVLIDELIREYPTQKKMIERFYRNIRKAANLVDSWIDEDLNENSGIIGMVIKYLKRLPYTITSKASLMSMSKRLDESLLKIMAAQVAYSSHLMATKDLLSISVAYLLSLPAWGLFYPRGGLMSLMCHLRGLFQSCGGILFDGCSIIRVETDPTITVDLDKEGAPTTLRGKKLIISSQWEKLDILLSGKRILPETSRPFSPVHIVSYPFCLHIGVHQECLPENMASYVVLFLGRKNSLIKGEFIFLQTSLSGDADRAPEGRRAITATVYIADSPLRLSDSDLRNVAITMIDSLEDFLPFLRENIDFLRVDESISFSRKYQEMGSKMYMSRRTPFWGLKTLTPKTRVSNVALTGSILRPSLGFEGQILAGLDAAIHVQDKMI